MSEDSFSIATRIEDIQEWLTEYQNTLDIRKLLTSLHMTSGKYCESCSTHRKPAGTCGSTCPLLKTITAPYHGFHLVRSEWKKDSRVFYRLLEDIELHAADVTEERLSTWEQRVLELKEGDLNFTDKNELDDWNICSRLVRDVLGLNDNWDFENTRSKGPGIEDGIAPDEVAKADDAAAVVKRDFASMEGGDSSDLADPKRAKG